MNCNYKENPGVLVKGMRGRGRGMDIETLQKPLPLTILRGKGKGMACCTQGLPLLITNCHLSLYLNNFGWLFLPSGNFV